MTERTACIQSWYSFIVVMNFVAFAWIASVLYGLEVVTSKLISKYAIANGFLFNFIWSAGILLLTLPLALYSQVSWPRHWESLIIAGVSYGLTGVFFILSLYRFDVSVLAPLYNIRSVMSVLLAFLILGERLSSGQIFLSSIIVGAGVLVTLDEKWSLRSFANRNLLLVLGQMFNLSLLGIYTNKAIGENGFWSATLFIPVVAQLVLLFTIPFFVKDVRSLNKTNVFSIGLVAVLGTVATLAANAAYAQNVSISTIIISVPVSMILAFLFSVFAPKLLEKHTLKVYAVRFAAASVMLVAAIKLSLM